MTNAFIYVHALGAAQGLFLAALLFSKRHYPANLLLGWAMAAFSVDLAMAVYHASGLVYSWPYLIGVDYPLALAYGPLLYLYARTLIEGRYPRGSAWHFAPFVMLTVALIPFFLQPSEPKLQLLSSTESSPGGHLLGVVNNAKLAHAFLYVVFTVFVLRRHGLRIKEQFSSLERINLTWLRNLMIAMIVVMVATLTLYALSVREVGLVPGLGLNPESLYDDYTLLVLAGLVYAIGFLGLRQPAVFHGKWDTERPSGPQYARSGMDAATAEQLQRRLMVTMEESHPYRSGDLTLKDLADAAGMSPHQLTEVLNTRLGVSFYEFVNGYRVREAQSRLRDAAYANLSVLAVGMDAGFQSKSSFNAVFKKMTGETPSEYRNGG